MIKSLAMLRRSVFPLMVGALTISPGARAEEWPMFGRDHTNRHFSPLTDIDRGNVAKLRPAWIFQTGITGYFQAEPVVVDGVMYVSTTQNHVAALEAKTGRVIWTYTHKARTEKIFGPPSNRGVAVSGGKVFEATMDGRVIALDAKTGKVLWDHEAVRPEEGESETASDLAGKLGAGAIQGSSRLGFKMPPLVADGLVIVGVAGAGYGLHVEDEKGGLDGGAVVGIEGGYGRRGWLAAYDAATGEERWRWYVTKEDGWEGGFVEKTADGVPLNRDIAAEKAAAPRHREAWKVGGGSLWMTPAYDADLGLIYVGTGNPAPQNFGLSRPGDNLYTMSLVALEVKTGKLRWYYQQVPHDEWGYDVASPPLPARLRDAARSGEGGRRGEQDRLALRPRPGDRHAPRQVRAADHSEEPLRTAHRDRNRRQPRSPRGDLLASGRLRSDDEHGLCPGPSRRDDLHGEDCSRRRRQAADPFHRNERGEGRAFLQHAHGCRPRQGRRDQMVGKGGKPPFGRHARHRRRSGLLRRGGRPSRRP